MRSVKTIVVIGGSTGALETLLGLVRELRPGSGAAIFVVVHVGAHKSELPSLLTRAGVLSAQHPKHGDVIEADRIYVAPPDHHMTVSAGHIELSRGPRENWARPAIDPLFRSAARVFGEAVMGVILTGGLNDGTAGLFEIKARGGVTLVQDPRDALCAQMPQSALSYVEVDHVEPGATLGRRLASLLNERRARAEACVATASNQETKMTIDFTLDRPMAITCPDCGGALRRSQVGALVQFTCHIGHAYTAEVMVAAQFVAMGGFLEAALRALNERAEICRFRSAEAHEGEHTPWLAARDEALQAANAVREMLERDWLQPS